MIIEPLSLALLLLFSLITHLWMAIIWGFSICKQKQSVNDFCCEKRTAAKHSACCSPDICIMKLLICQKTFCICNYANNLHLSFISAMMAASSRSLIRPATRWMMICGRYGFGTKSFAPCSRAAASSFSAYPKRYIRPSPASWHQAVWARYCPCFALIFPVQHNRFLPVRPCTVLQSSPQAARG